MASGRVTYLFYVTDRPQNNFQIEGNHFRAKQEFKFGFGYRKAPWRRRVVPGRRA